MTGEALKSKRIGVLLGGLSSEREVSLKTGAAAVAALGSLGYDAVPIDVGRDLAHVLQRERIEVAFNALHGTYGEDGCVQGLLELLGIPYSGSGVLASAMGMDKIISKYVFEREGLPVAEYAILRQGGEPAAPPFGFPCVVKPRSEGSSVGVTIVQAQRDLAAAVAEARRHGADVLIERYIAGREVCVAVLDDEPLGTVEIRPQRAFYDYQAKYLSGDTRYLAPAPLDPPVERRLLELGARAHSALGCRGATRADFRLSEAGEPYLLEVNTLPGMTEKSLLPMVAAQRGIGFGALCERLALGARCGA
jgi:D-alanine-D-alanine ligase